MSPIAIEEKLNRISQYSKQGVRVQNLAYMLDAEMLTWCFHELDANKATGIDKMTKAKYGEDLESNIANLVSRLKSGTYRPQPSLRVNIPKPGTDKTRPIGVSCFEDKIVERAIAKILEAVYEPKFLDCSFGFRPSRNCHIAISKLLGSINARTSFIVEADFRSFFDTLLHDKALGFLERDIADRRFIKLISLGLQQGHLEDGIYYDNETGTAQGSGYSPILANVYLYYVLDTWTYSLLGRVKDDKTHPEDRADPKDRIYGDCELVRYADDFVLCFQRYSDARKYYDLLKKRVEAYGLSLAPEKTRILPFGRFAEDSRARYGGALGYDDQPVPETFDFLGFTFHNSTARNRRDCKGNPKYCCKVKSIGKRMRRKLQELRKWIKENQHMRMKDTIDHLNRVLNGYFEYYAVTNNSKCINSFRYHLTHILFKWKNRRSQKRSFNWDQFNAILARYPLEPAKIRVNIYQAYEDWKKEKEGKEEKMKKSA